MPVTLPFVAVLIAAVLCISLLGIVLREKDRRKRQLVLGTQLLQAGRVLLTHLQQHRGLSSARHSGVSSSLEEVNQLRAQIVVDMRQLSCLDVWLAEHPDWEGITRHWASLSANGRQIRAEDSFNQHSRLIASLMTLLESIASHYGLDTNPRYIDSWIVWREYLKIGELVGQCRALGVQVFTCASHEQRYRQINLIKSNLDAIERLLLSPACSRKLSKMENDAIVAFVGYLREQIDVREMSDSVMDYYQRATETIDMVYEHFDLEMRKLHRRLTAT
ncbi:nitrate/nitrite sensing protein [Alteromonadaceae bacterium 2753L.S.0a.02]|nr:nitrate/nitrite sensing protein [Alteromonadaceae bacterium 2753L.S.0a.02]